MCKWDHEAKIVSRKMAGTPIEQYFNNQVLSLRPPETVLQGHCLECGRSLSSRDMFPAGREPRYMCRSCYEAKAYGDPHHCLLCGQRLPHFQVNQRQANPRELKYAFCQGECLDYHKVLAGIVLGIPFNTIHNQAMALPWQEDEDEIVLPQTSPVQIGYRPIQPSPNRLPAKKRSPNGVKYLPFPKPRR